MEGVRRRDRERQQLSGLNENMWMRGASAKEGDGGSSACVLILVAL